MNVLFAIFLALHGSIHLLGAAKAFRVAELPQLTQPISPVQGGGWLAAAALFIAAAVAVLLWPRGWWILGALAVVVSFAVIVPAWSDAKYGAVANVVALVGVLFGFLTYGPGSLRAEYEQDVLAIVSRPGNDTPLTEDDLRPLPEPVRRYLRVTGAVGQPKVRNVFARMTGRIRSGPEAAWMAFTAEQHNVFGGEPSRLFYMTASRALVPAQGYHRYVGADATMRIKAAAIVPLVDLAGPEMTEGETVTLFNDMCVLAPASLVDPAIEWEPIAERTVRARFTSAGRTIQAELTFEASGELKDFRSPDRYRVSEDGGFERRPWSTPLGAYRSFGPARLASGGAGHWHGQDGTFTYIELAFDEVRYNVSAR